MIESMDKDFAGRTAWVIGATGTLGEAMAGLLNQRGAQLAIAGRDQQKLEALAAGLGNKTLVTPLNLRDGASVAEAARQVNQTLGPVDLLVVSVAVPAFGDFLSLDDEAFAAAMETKYMGALRAIRQVLPGMIERRFGRIVVLSGGGGTVPRPVHLPGGGANAALELVARGLALRYANDGIRVNIVAPGPIASPRMDQIVAATEKSGGDESHRPIGQPRDVAEAVCYLLSERSGFINGTVLKVDGGVK